MGTTPLTGAPFPDPTGNAIADLLEVPDLALHAEKYQLLRFATTTARDAAIPTPETGMHCIVGHASGPAVVYAYVGTAWQVMSYVGVQKGVTSATLTAQSTRQVALVFPVAYAAAPHVQCSLNKADAVNYGLSLVMESLTATGVTFRISHTAGTNITVGLGVHWRAEPA